MKTFGLVVASTTLMAVTPAMATTVAPPPLIIFTPGSNAMPGYVSNPIVFEDFTPDNGFSNNQRNNGMKFSEAQGVRGSATGNVRIFDRNVIGKAIGPLPAQGPFLSIDTHSSYTVTFAGAGVQVFSFLIGTLDSYNSVKLKYKDGTYSILNGLGIVGNAPGVGFQASGRVTFDRQGKSGIIGVIFSSTGTAMEIDGIQSAAPEPGTWGMMILGFGIAGAALRARRRPAHAAAA